MLNQTIKSNINKIDYDLKKLFSDVTITEKNHFNKYFFEVKSEGIFENLLESNSNKVAKSLVLIEKKHLESDLITWKYSINPNNSGSDFIERVSTIEKIAEDIHNTITKKQMDIDYLNNLPEIDIVEDEQPENTFEGEILNVIEKFDLIVNDINTTINEKKVDLYDLQNKNILIYHEGIETSDMFKLESELLKFERVNYVFFNRNHIKVNYN